MTYPFKLPIMTKMKDLLALAGVSTNSKLADHFNNNFLEYTYLIKMVLIIALLKGVTMIF